MKILIFLSISCFLIYGCRQPLINTKQTNSNYPIVFRIDEKNSYKYSIEFPLVFEINKSLFSKKVELSDPTYYYHTLTKYNPQMIVLLSNIKICIVDKKKLEECNSSNPIFIGNTKQEYIFYTQHYIFDTTQMLQKFLKPYWDKMKALGKDTLHIASIQELKKTNPELLNTFLKGDSIRFIFYYDEIFDSHIKLPVEIK